MIEKLAKKMLPGLLSEIKKIDPDFKTIPDLVSDIIKFFQGIAGVEPKQFDC